MSYIGKTIRLKKRIQEHKSKNSTCTYLRNAIQKYGWENFQVSTIWEGDNSVLGDMEKKFIKEHNTLVPNGYNIREGGEGCDIVSNLTKTTMREIQQEISKRRNGLLGSIIENKSKANVKITSWSFIAHKDGKPYVFFNSKIKEKVLQFQKEFTNNPNNFEIPQPKKVPNGMSSGVYFCSSDKRKKRWQVQFRVKGEIVSLGRYETKEEALEVANKYKQSPDKFVKPNKIDKNRDDIGITFQGNPKRWRASFWNGKKNIFLGNYNTKEEAIDARKGYIDDPYNFVRPNQRKPIHNT